MTLPQQLEPFTMSDNPMLTVALKHGKLPYITELGQLYLLIVAVAELNDSMMVTRLNLKDVIYMSGLNNRLVHKSKHGVRQ